MKHEIEAVVAAATAKLFATDVVPELTRPDEQFGDYTTNVAMQLTKQVGKSPKEIAETLVSELKNDPLIKTAEVAGPGFVNLTLNDDALATALQADITGLLAGQRVLLEYSCPNAFKELHTGHLYQTVVGDSLGRLLEATGATVFRANFGGDVGLHVAKCMYGIVEKLGGEKSADLVNVPETERAEWLSAAYVAGAKAYEENDEAKKRITTINNDIYVMHTMDDHESEFAKIYWTCRDWSYDYFRDFYESIEVVAFDKFYPESTTTTPGLELVRAHTPDVFVESDGAIIYPGEDAGLHTRVFITGKGLPTYETKDLGVILSEVKDFVYDKRVIITGNDQSEYMKVVFAALHAIDTDLAGKQNHLAHGTIRFGSGQKMSSRLGNVTRAVDVIDTVGAAAQAKDDETRKQVTLGAMKYSFLRHRLGGDIAFDVNESVSLDGNSGPYLQYAHARARSILAKAPHFEGGSLHELDGAERSLARKLGEYEEIVELAVHELRPHHICSYLYDLAQVFNRFYEQSRVIGDAREALRLTLVRAYALTLEQGLGLLGIDAPVSM
jgi:arginyl-tRNA synthetase